MKNTQPVTDIEIEVLDNRILVSECDLEGNIIYANQAFCEISGYSLEQLIGVKHNIVRHPDMPAQIYDDLWQSLKDNKTWRGILKNRCSNGDHYWVLATVKPISDDHGNIISYRSLRRKATLEAIEQTKTLYQRLNNGEKINLNKLNPYKRHKIDKLINLAIYNYAAIYAFISSSALATLYLFDYDRQTVFSMTVLNIFFITFAMLYRNKLRLNAINKMNESLQTLLKGDLSSRVEYPYLDEFKSTFRLFNQSAEIIEVSFSEINQSLHNINEGDFEGVTKFSMNGDFNILKEHLNSTIQNTKERIYLINKRIKVFTESELTLNEPDDQNNINEVLSQKGYYKKVFNTIDDLLLVHEARKNNRLEIVERAQKGDFSSLTSYTGHNIGAISDLSIHLNDLFRTIEQNLMDISNMAHRISEGDLGMPIDNHYLGLFADSVNGIDNMRQSLKSMIEVMADSIIVIHDASLKISNGNMDFAQRTEVQSVNLKKNAVAMETLLTQVKNTADAAHLANQLVLETSTIAIQGGKSVDEVVNTMAAIDDSSRKVANIISVIDDIAFQTNILSLNASVEAARAGEQGRGFAVVASEVRSLAQRSTTAAKEIKSLINESVINVENGNARVENAGKTIQEVVTYVNRLTQIMADISSAASEQSTSIDQVNDVITQIDNITQLNNILAGETIDAALVLEKQSRALREMIDKYSGLDTTLELDFDHHEHLKPEEIRFELF